MSRSDCCVALVSVTWWPIDVFPLVRGSDVARDTRCEVPPPRQGALFQKVRKIFLRLCLLQKNPESQNPEGGAAKAEHTQTAGRRLRTKAVTGRYREEWMETACVITLDGHRTT